MVVETLRKARNDLCIAKRMIENQNAEVDATACNEIVINWVYAMVEEVGREEVKEVSNRRELQKYFVLAAKVFNDLIKEIGEDVGEIALTAIIEADEEKQDKVKLSRERLQKKLMRKVFRVEKNCQQICLPVSCSSELSRRPWQ